jgi:hypothetical protein
LVVASVGASDLVWGVKLDWALAAPQEEALGYVLENLAGQVFDGQ